MTEKEYRDLMHPTHKEMVCESLAKFAGFSPERQRLEIAHLQGILRRNDSGGWQDVYEQDCIRAIRIFLRVVRKNTNKIEINLILSK